MLTRRVALLVKKMLKTRSNKIIIGGKNDSSQVYVIAKSFSLKDIDQFFIKLYKGEKKGQYEALSFDIYNRNSNVAFSVF